MQPTQHIQHTKQSAHTNLDQDLGVSRESKYQKSHVEVLQWIYSVLKVLAQEQAQHAATGSDLMDVLRDGQKLCQIGNMYGLESSPTAKCRNSRMPFIQMENIMFFLQFCEMVGVAHDEIFQTVDLFERKDPYQVVVTLMAFSRIANRNQPDKFQTVIGPRKVRVKPQVPVKPLLLKQSN